MKYIEPHKEVIDAGGMSFVGLDALMGWDVVTGLAFENLVINNYRYLLRHLHLGNALLKSAAPYMRHGSKARGDRGVQIDLLLQTEGALCVVEIKHREHIGKEVIEEMKEKIAALPRPKDVSVRPVLVYAGEISPVVEATGYFDAIIPFARLLGL